MNKETARIYLDVNVKLIETLENNLPSEEFGKLNVMPNRVTYCTDNKGEMAMFCLIGIGLGLKVEYLIANSFFSPISVSYKDLNKVETDGSKVHISGNTFKCEFESVK